MTQLISSLTCADILIISIEYLLLSSSLSTLVAVDDLPVPTGPVNNTGYPLAISLLTRKLYRTVSIVGTTIL